MELSHNIVSFFSRYQRYILVFFIIFYLVGFLGLVIPYTYHLFLNLFPLALILSFSAILLSHKDRYDTKTIYVFVLIGVWSFMIEVTGVNTHLIFGNYSYGNALGLKLFNTPLLIAINWVMLTYAGSSITERLSMPDYLKIIIASTIILVYDIILEQVASVLDMWYWKDNVVPFQNYLAWFIIAFLFQSFIRLSKVSTRNSIAVPILLIQTLFFISLFTFFQISK